MAGPPEKGSTQEVAAEARIQICGVQETNRSKTVIYWFVYRAALFGVNEYLTLVDEKQVRSFCKFGAGYVAVSIYFNRAWQFF